MSVIDVAETGNGYMETLEKIPVPNSWNLNQAKQFVREQGYKVIDSESETKILTGGDTIFIIAVSPRGE